MAPKGKNRNEDLKQEDVLQAVIIADSFNVRFGPITLGKPRILLPLVNVPLIDYTLEALAASKVQEVFVFCCHLGEQVRDHIMKSKWQKRGSPMTVTTLMLESCLSMGDALREIDAKSLIRSDFILISGDIVANMDIAQVVKEHRACTQGKDKDCVMTMLFKVAQPGHRTRSKEDDMYLIEDGGTGRLLYFQKSHDCRKIQVPKKIFQKHDDIISHNDLMDCHVCICSPIVPTLFTDNFDYQTREDFVKGILINEEIMGKNIHLNIIRDKYAARVSNLQTYDAISKDVINRWTYPLVPDMFGSTQKGERIKYGRHNVYCSEDVTLSRGCELLKDTVVGSKTVIGSGTVISNCVIGKECRIGENVTLKNSFLWDNVVVEDNCEVDTALLCSGAKVLHNVVIKKRVILSWEVIVGPNITLTQGTALMSEPQKDEFDDPDLSFGDDERTGSKQQEEVERGIDTANYGAGSKAYLYKPYVDSDDGEDGAGGEIAWGVSASESDERLSSGDDSDVSREGQDEEEGELALESDEEEEDVIDVSLGCNPKACILNVNSAFYQELVDTFVRAITEKIKDDNLILEINSLKHAYTVPIEEVIHSLPNALIQLAAHQAGTSNFGQPAVVAGFRKNVERYASLLSKYIKNTETQLAAINGLGDFVIKYREIRPRLPQLLNFMYDADILTENVIFSWYNSSHFTPGSNEALRHAFLRRQALPFIKWLQEAEEETSDEDEED